MKNKQLLVIIALALGVLLAGAGLFWVVAGDSLVNADRIAYRGVYTAPDEPFTNWQDAPLEVNVDKPEDSVLSYLLWTSWGYYIGKSDLAVEAMSAFEEPRVTAYINKLMQDDKRINQRLDSLEILSVEESPFEGEGQQAGVFSQQTIVKTREAWTYNYQNLKTEKWEPPQNATYEATYKVLYKDDVGKWYVDSVEIDSSTGVE